MTGHSGFVRLVDQGTGVMTVLGDVKMVVNVVMWFMVCVVNHVKETSSPPTKLQVQ